MMAVGEDGQGKGFLKAELASGRWGWEENMHTHPCGLVTLGSWEYACAYRTEGVQGMRTALLALCTTTQLPHTGSCPHRASQARTWPRRPQTSS